MTPFFFHHGVVLVLHLVEGKAVLETEQPPPVTNTRSLSSGLPSSSISCLTLFARCR